MNPAVVDISIVRGDDWIQQLRIREGADRESAVPVDWSGCSAAAQIRSAPNSSTAVDLTVSLGQDGLVALSLARVDTLTLPLNGVWDLSVNVNNRNAFDSAAFGATVPLAVRHSGEGTPSGDMWTVQLGSAWMVRHGKDGSLAVRALPGQTVNVQEWQDSTGAVKASVAPSGDIEVTDPAKGVILRSPDNSRWRITVDNLGNLGTTKL